MRIFLAAAFTMSSVALAVVPVDGGSPAVPTVDINTGPGQHFDPHVSGNIAAYSSSPADEIRFYNFTTAADGPVPSAPGFRDILSDVSGSLVVFTRMSMLTAKDSVYVYDVTSAAAPVEIDPQPDAQRIGAAIGGQTIAFSDFGLGTSGTGEIIAYNYMNSSKARLTNDLAYDQSPSVAPNGRVVVWEKCATSLVNCDIWKGVFDTATLTWTASVVANTTSPESNPDTDGTYIVYNSQRPGTLDQDIFFRTLSGPEIRLELDGPQTNASISEGVIAFESNDPLTGFRDIYLYRIADNRMFRLTSSAFIDELFEDISVLPGGQVRIVWTRDDGLKQDVIGATISLPAPPTPPSGCDNRLVAIEATKTYCPPHTTDGSATFNPAIRFALPGQIPVVDGNAANKQATLVIKRGSQQITCRYKGQAKNAHPKSPAQLALAASYKFEKCLGDGKDLKAGDFVLADKMTLHIVQGDTHKSKTVARVLIAEVCGPVPPVPGHDDNKCSGDDDDHGDDQGDRDDDDQGDRDDDDDSDHHGRGRHDRDDDHGSSSHELTAGDKGAPASAGSGGQVGCSSTGSHGGFVFAVALFAAWLMSSQRRVTRRVAVRVTRRND